MSNGLFITIDGAGGTGKTTVASLLKGRLAGLGFAVHTTAEPSNAQLGCIARHQTELYRGIVLACLVAADRYQHLNNELRPQRESGRIVICDRYVASSYVLQQMDGVEFEFIKMLNIYADRPDLMVILTGDPRELWRRIKARGVHSRFENNIDATALEVALYSKTTMVLTAMGHSLLQLDSTIMDPSQIVDQIVDRITALR